MRIALRIGIHCAIFVALLAATTAAAETDPLPSWNDGAARQSVVDFVTRVTDPAGPDFVLGPEGQAIVADGDVLLHLQEIRLVALLVRGAGGGAAGRAAADVRYARRSESAL